MPEDKAPPPKPSNVVLLKEDGTKQGGSRLPDFIRDNVELIVGHWEAFARSLTPSSSDMSPLALRDHIHQILAFIVPDIEAPQSSEEQKQKSLGNQGQDSNTAAETHAALRLAGGFNIGQMVSEYRALRASVLKLWSETGPAFDAQDVVDITRFNEAIDQELGESVDYYTRKVDQSKDLVVGILGHDLRGPIQAIMLSAELTLHMGKMNERQTMLTKAVLESAVRMGDLINTLLDVTRARFGTGLPVIRAMMNMGFVARQIVEEVRIVHPKRAIDLTMTGSLMGEWDKARIGQVFSNLLGNAMQYGFPGSPVRVDLKGEPRFVMLSVANDGAPIPPEKMDTIFSPLVRVGVAGSSVPPSGNLGLGLYITKEVVVAHGGTIEVSSTEADGTVFTVCLPRSAPAPQREDAQRHEGRDAVA